MDKWIMHLDMDAFFAAVEQRDHPEYRGRPLVVGARPGGRGVVSTCSYEARRYGIRSAMPISEACRRCPDAIYLRPDMARYTEASRRVMAVLDEVSPLVEQVSVNEAYLDISGLERLFGSPARIGRLTKRKVFEAVGLTCSVGIGPNRLIAKLASDYRKPDGITLVAPDAVQAFLDPMPVANLRGVGPVTLGLLQRLGIRTVAQLRALPLELLQAHLGERGGSHLHAQARGRGSDRIEAAGQRQSVSKETTFGQDVSDIHVLKNCLRQLASDVGHTLRREGLRGRVATFKVRLPGFETHTRQRRLGEAVDSDVAIYKSAWALYEASGFIGRPVRLIGLGMSGWEEEAAVIEDLFTPREARDRERRLYGALDEMALKFGHRAVSLGVKKGRG
ncbi:MAG: DNA polymerase IV [Candidatus Sedimenticola endophacoides]|nr:MAG: DNA polymerase IV [Candidatus Sedimenticola endophacoides]OQX37704.1 MAG: DNA polymerase IV [Candidatus Sedimenticola endophacoides]OQX39040.1 MAG: DNA polymerase IV [Candidatus Sedimenticola endophacoides]OQX43790.1 MAG: DNA polymerase IV [Candidatus Sedimenticola endophacoides]